MLFKLIQIAIGVFAIVKASDAENKEFPINVHGFIRIVDSVESDKFNAVCNTNMISEDLSKSKEIDKLKEEAIAITGEAVADEFSD